MCGVFGLVVERDSDLDPASIGPLLRRLYRVSESRGKEAAGLALHIEGQPGIEVQKAAVRGSRLIATPSSRRLLDLAREGVAQGARVVLLGHTRMVTNGDPSDNGNNQPVAGDRVIVLHNGIITNEGLLWEQNPDLERAHEVDTELVMRLIERDLARGASLESSFRDVVHTIAGANTLAVLDGESGDLALGTANGSLYLTNAVAPDPQGDSDERTLVFASEAPILERALERRSGRRIGARASRRGSAFEKPHQSLPGRTLLLPGDGSSRKHGETAFGEIAARPTDHRRGRAPGRSTRTAASLVGLAEVDHAAIARLQRCTRCVLPETFPGIGFDTAGVCSVCASYQSPQTAGILELGRRIGPGAKVLFPLSGGRDSCYGLHVAVRELGLTVVAFTYDWGMVTDLARRNISRMCGELGVEHILISADIARKRSHVRKNVLAWLDRPNLGTIPLFMAGDKQFFFHAQRLRRQHEARLVLFSMNPYERTDFKVGFAGVADGGSRKAMHYDLDLLGKFRVLGFYGSEMLRNRGFLNASLIDSATGYLSYYAIPKDYASLYDFLEWREADVDRVLVEEYGWETSPDSTTTWRIGDGTAPFYNYLYLRIAGFTENDALRSNQIRAGHVTRDWAMARLDEENVPRHESLAWYLDTIGLDAVDVIERVNRIPLRHPLGHEEQRS